MSDTKVPKHKVTWKEIYERVGRLPKRKCWGIPRGGQVIAGLTGHAVDKMEEAEYIVDDIFDSGNTYRKWRAKTKKPIFYLFNKKEEHANTWVVFPWESEKETQMDIYDTVVRQMEYIGEDASRKGLVSTPQRIVKSWGKLYGGYQDNPEEILNATFQQKYNQIVLLKNIELYSTCEHHMLPFYGKCHIAYIPNGMVVGISKLARLMECYTRRLQIQERIGEQIVDDLERYLKPQGSACIIEAQHFCMTSRGVEKQHSIMSTSALRGVFMNKPEARQELLRLIK